MWQRLTALFLLLLSVSQAQADINQNLGILTFDVNWSGFKNINNTAPSDSATRSCMVNLNSSGNNIIGESQCINDPRYCGPDKYSSSAKVAINGTSAKLTLTRTSPQFNCTDPVSGWYYFSASQGYNEIYDFDLSSGQPVLVLPGCSYTIDNKCTDIPTISAKFVASAQVTSFSAQYDPATKKIYVPLLSINGNIFKNIVLIVTNPVVSDDGYLSNGTISVEGNPFAETAVASEGTPIAYFDQATMSLIFPTFNVSGFNSVFMQTLELNGSLFYPAEYNKRPASTSQNWRDFLKKIKPGDILLLGEQQGCNSNPDACFFTATEKGVLWNGTLTWELSYGYLSHAAIVASVSDDGTLLKVFNARNQGEGVGTDWLDEQFIRNKYKVINVVRANGAYDGAAVVSNAISKYSSFFYDPFPFSILAIPYKVKEKNHDTSNSTFCADLVGRAFADFGIDVRDQQKYDSGGAFFQIRDLTGASVLAVKSTLFTPDALSLSGNISPVTSLLY